MTRPDVPPLPAEFALYALLGPISGPLLAGIVRHYRTAPVLAGLYATALGFWELDWPHMLAWAWGFYAGLL